MKKSDLVPTGIYRNKTGDETRKIINLFAFDDALRYVVVASPNPRKIGKEGVVSVSRFARWAAADIEVE